ncbi:MAG: hypothetical protein QOK02_6410, partial [Mycobacterium sp.]|nr:hypothetical protein [Mycobacterium sp.]
MAHSKSRIIGEIVDLQGVLVDKGVTKVLNAQCVTLLDRVIVAGILE